MVWCGRCEAAREEPCMAETEASEATSATTSAPRPPTALVYEPAMLEHQVPEGFPEVPARLQVAKALIDALIANGTIPASDILELPARPATPEELHCVHTPEYVARVRGAVEALGEGYTGRPRRFATD